MIIGSHVSFNSKDQLLGSVKEALGYNANTFMFYTGAPQNAVRKSIDNNLTLEAKKLMKENNIDINNVICHAAYIINLANNKESSKYDFSINFLKSELSRCEQLGVQYLVLHPGSSVGIERNISLDNIINGLNIVLTDNTKIMILLETMAGKGTECGITLEELKYIIDGVKLKSKIGICIDTCHLNDAGYNMIDFDEFLSNFDSIIGINYIKCVHVNDSKNNIGTHKDRHENIGLGTIGFDALLNIVNCDKLKNIPKILETPYIGDDDNSKERIYPPYKYEIDMLKKGEFNNNFKEDIRNEYKK